MENQLNDVGRPVVRKHRLDKDTKNAILERFGKPVAFWREAGLQEKITLDSIYRAFRGDPVNLAELTAIKSAWITLSHTYLKRETALKILEFGIEAAKLDTNVPMTVKAVFDNLVNLNHKEPF